MSLPSLDRIALPPHVQSTPTVTGQVVSSYDADLRAIVESIVGPEPITEQTFRVAKVLRAMGVGQPSARTRLQFHFATIAALTAIVREEVPRHATIRNHSMRTVDIALTGYTAFIRYLEESRNEHLFLAGDPRAQHRIIEDWICYLREAGRTPSTVQNYWRGAKDSLGAVAATYGMDHPFDGLKMPKAGGEHRPCPTEAEVRQIFEFVRHNDWGSSERTKRNHAIVALSALAGLRRSEVLRLGFGDVDLDEGFIRVIAGKGRNGGKDRTVPICPELKTILAEYVEVRRRRRTNATSFLLGAEDAGISDSTMKRLYAEIRQVLSIQVSSHPLRRSFATRMANCQIPDTFRMRYLGHSDPRMLQIYERVSASDDQAMIGRLTFHLPP